MDNGKLGSWKEIAQHLGVTVRAAQNWEKQRGMPVHRLPGERGPVFAFVDELDRWRQADPGLRISNGTAHSEASGTGPRRLGIKIGLAASLLALAGIGGGVCYSVFRKGDPADYRIDGEVLTVLDARGRELWHWNAGVPFLDFRTYPQFRDRMRLVHIDDLDDDGLPETLVIPRQADVMKQTSNIPLACLDHRGRTKWTFQPGAKLTTVSGKELPDLFLVSNFEVARLAPGRRKSILVSAPMIHEFACQIVLLDAATGTKQREYWHSGHIGNDTPNVRIADLDGNGVSEIYLAGANNSHRRRTVLALDPDRFEGFSREEKPDYQLAGDKAGRELWRALIPETCLQRAAGTDIGNIVRLDTVPAGLRLMVAEGFNRYGDVARVTYYFQADGRIAQASISNDFREVHVAAQRAADIDHPFDLQEERELERAAVTLRPSIAGRR